ncbi:MAG: serine/threonine-protein kinase [Verrucomicrobiota bacterium JB025]|nr:serine/threonine-protein kinase [Verrucomicrobiota bacterium JB025]
MNPDAQRRVTDRRLVAAYHEANQLDEAGFEAISPLYHELSEVAVRYRDECLISKGGSKEVSRVYDSRTKKWLAMARPRADLGPEQLDRFVHEAWLTSSLVHPNIINIYDVGVDVDGRPYFTMDLKSDRTLADYLGIGDGGADGQEVDERELLEIYLKVCDAVAYAHSRGILHLDLKPDNIQVDRFGEVLVCDWGLGKSVEEVDELEMGEGAGDEAASEGMTLNGEIKGTPGFMAPEQVTPGGERDERTDCFALGCMLYGILTGAPVFTGKSGQEILEQTREREIVPPRERFPELKIPARLEAVVMKAVARDPARRYATVNELRRDIARYLSGHTTEAENPGFIQEVGRFVWRNQLASAVMLVSVVSLTVVSVLFVQGIQNHRTLARMEHRRAEKLLSRANTLQQTTVSLASQIESREEDREYLASEIARSCLRLFSRLIFRSTEPLVAYQRISDLADQTLAIDPQNQTTQVLRFRLANMQMNFAKSAGLLPIVREHVPFNQAWIAEHFSGFAFDLKSRPTIGQLVGFLDGVEEETNEPTAFLDSLLAFDVETRPATDDYGPVIRRFLRFVNPGWSMENFQHDPEARSLTIGFGPGFRFNTFDGARPILRHLKLRTLRLVSTDPADLSSLDGLSIQEIDLRECPLGWSEPARFPGLLKIHVDAGRADLDAIRSRILSDKPLEIVEHPLEF